MSNIDSVRWAYRRVYVADGNFKADHVRRMANHDELWLWDGAGMMPNNSKYADFLRTAVERNTACVSPQAPTIVLMTGL